MAKTPENNLQNWLNYWALWKMLSCATFRIECETRSVCYWTFFFTTSQTQNKKMSESRPDIPIPEGLPKLMQDFVVTGMVRSSRFFLGLFHSRDLIFARKLSRIKRTVLRQQPDDLLNHAVEYFNNLKVFHRLCFLFLLVISLNIVTGLPRLFRNELSINYMA